MKHFIKQALFLTLVSTLIQCANIFEPLTPKDSNAALLYSARKNIDSRMFDAALLDFEQMDPLFAAQNEVRLAHASAYAGACGMQFIPFFNNISQADLTPPNSLFKYLRSSFTNQPTLPQNCVLAESKLKEIGMTAAERQSAMNGSKEINMLMAILSMAKVGSILRIKSDKDGPNDLGDGNTDNGFDSCVNSDDHLTDDEVIEIATGFALLIENLPALLGDINDTSTALEGVSTIIGLFCGLSPKSKCLTPDKGTIEPADRAEFIDTYRDLIKTEAVGIESCAPNLPDTPDSCCP